MEIKEAKKEPWERKILSPEELQKKLKEKAQTLDKSTKEKNRKDRRDAKQSLRNYT